MRTIQVKDWQLSIHTTQKLGVGIIEIFAVNNETKEVKYTEQLSRAGAITWVKKYVK